MYIVEVIILGKKVTSVFYIALAVCMIFVIWGSIQPTQMEEATAKITSFFSEYFGWYYLILVLLFLVFCIYLMFSKFGKIRLGKEGEKPEFSTGAWFAMLFSAGMGIGLVFWTTAEPTQHAFLNAPVAEVGTPKAINDAMKFAFFHWGIHAWAVYAIVALVFAYFSFHRGYPNLVSSTLIPIFGEARMKGWLGQLVDILAVLATVFGVAATLGFGTGQINGGLNYLFDIPQSFTIQLIILIVATALFIISAWSGIGKGIKVLSTSNMGLAFVLLLVLFIVGPSMYILNTFTNALGNYVADFFQMSLRIAPEDDEARKWINDWTIFYWAWWISWAPFVGIFIARVSRGRTIRQFMAGVLIVPALVCFLFFAVFGTSAIHLEKNGLAKISEATLETATFMMLEQYPLGFLLSLITIVVIAIFFITSADSATFVLGMLSGGGTNTPHAATKISWGIILSAIAAVIMFFGGTQGLQNLLIIAALPFSIVMILMSVSFYKSAKSELFKKKSNI